MLTIMLQQADNGIIKTISDDNINGAGEPYESTLVYNTDDNKDFKITKKFLYDLTNDLNLDTGNKFDKNNLIMTSEWGLSYVPNDADIKNKIKLHEIEISYLQEMLKTKK